MEKLLNSLYRDSLSLLTDLYELTMAYAYWKNGLQDRHAAFQLFFRKAPFQGTYALVSGIQTAIEYIENLHFDEEDLDYLASLKNPAGGPLFEAEFLEYLRALKMEVDVDAMEEGTLVFPNEPIVSVRGPIIQAQILETALLNIINFQTLIATKASRVCRAAEGDHIVEFGLRRAQGIDGGISASRAAFVGGCHSTSNVLAGKLFDIPVLGTHAHSFVMTYADEIDAFRDFAHALPKSCIFLIDTYDTIKGAKKAVQAAQELRKEGIELIAVRLDSGNLEVLSKQVRVILDEGGFEEAKIMATNELTEELIADLKDRNAPISLWGVGTNLVTAKDQPALDGVYKLSAVSDASGKWQYRLKISDQTAKTTNPGISQVRRYSEHGQFICDMLFDRAIGPGKRIVAFDDSHQKKTVDPAWESVDLLVPMLIQGKRSYTFPSLSAMRTRSYEQLAMLEPGPYFSGLEEKLYDVKLDMIREIQSP